MSLQVWLPLNGNLNNNGCQPTSITQYTTAGFSDGGKIGRCWSSGLISFDATAASKAFADTNTSVCFWFNNNGAMTGDCAICGFQGNGYSSAIRTWDFFNYPSKNDLHWSMSSLGGGVLYGVFTDNVWHHVVFTKDTTTLRIYIDGVLQTAEASSNPGYSYNNNYFIGASGTSYKLNDFRVYNHCLSEAEVKALASGLVAHYPLNSGYIEPTSNSYAYTGDPYWSQTFYDGSTGQYGYNDSSNGKYEYVTTTNRAGVTKKMVKVSLRSARTTTPYVYIDYLSSYIVNNTYATVSLDMYSNCFNCWANPYSYYDGYYFSYWDDETKQWVGGTSTSISIPNIKPNVWNHIVYRIYRNTTEHGSGPGYLPVGQSASTGDYWLFDNVQVELKDHDTPYINGSRAETVVYDTSGYSNNGSISSTMAPTIIAGSPRYNNCAQFDGGNQSIQIPFNSFIQTDLFTINFWFYKSDWGAKGYETLIGGPSGFELEAKSSSTNQPYIVAYNWGGGTIPYTLNTWHMVTMTRTPSQTQYYLDGVLALTGSAGTIPTGNYFIGAWNSSSQQNFKGKMSDFRIYSTVLDQATITDLYNAPIKITKNGVLTTNGEVVE